MAPRKKAAVKRAKKVSNRRHKSPESPATSDDSYHESIMVSDQEQLTTNRRKSSRVAANTKTVADRVNPVLGKRLGENQDTVIPEPQGQRQLAKTVEAATEVPIEAVESQNSQITRGISTDTMLVRYDGSPVEAGSLKDGDLLLGIDGTARTVSGIYRGQERLYKVIVARLAPYPGVDLFATSQHILNLECKEQNHRMPRLNEPSLEDHKQRFGTLFGGVLSSPSTLPPFSSNELTKKRSADDYLGALRKAVAWTLAVKSGDNYASKRLKHTLNGTTGIAPEERSFKVRGPKANPKDFHSFSWANRDSMVGGLGRKADRTTFFATKEEAFEAAVAKSRELYHTGAITFSNLHQRYLIASAQKSGGQIPCDETIPGMSLYFCQSYCAIKTHFTRISPETNARRKQCVYFVFPGFPHDILSAEMQAADSDEAHVVTVQPNVSLLEESPLRAITTTVAELAGDLARVDTKNRVSYNVKFSKDFDYKHEAVPVNPYYLGLWLGDGRRIAPTICNNHETEIVNFLTRYAAELKQYLVYHGSLRYTITNKTALADRPLPSTVVTIPNRTLGRRLTTRAHHKALLKAGYTIAERGGYGRAHIWEPPADMDINEAVRPASVQPETYIPQDEHEQRIDIDDAESRKRMRGFSIDELLQKKKSKETADFEIPDSQSSENRLSSVNSSASQVLPPLKVKDTPASSDGTNHEGNIWMHLTSDREIMELVGEPEMPFIENEDDNGGVYEPSSEAVEITTEAQPGALSANLYYLDPGRSILDPLANDDLDNLAENALQSAAESLETGKVNHLMKAMRGLGVMTTRDKKGPGTDTKHIPDLYLRNDRSTRLHVLAGFLDADGSLDYGNNSFTFAQSKRWHTRLFDDVVTLARGLGFRISISDIKNKGHPSLQATLTGNIDKIPCLLKRKQAGSRYTEVQYSAPIRTIEPTEESEYIGFNVDKDHKYLRVDRMIMVASNGYELEEVTDADILNVDDLVEERPSIEKRADTVSTAAVQTSSIARHGLSKKRRVYFDGARFVSPNPSIEPEVVPESSPPDPIANLRDLTKRIGIKTATLLLVEHEIKRLYGMNEQAIRENLLENMKKDENFASIVSNAVSREGKGSIA